jgi:hypothetical protein
VPEVRRLLHAADEGAPRRTGQLRWSRRRRRHQAAAQRGHTARRAAERPPGRPMLRPGAVPGTPPLTEAAWAQLAPLLTAPPRRGKRRWEPRQLRDGILWVLRTGASWREVPARFAPWHTAYGRYARWRRDGTWARLRAALLPPEALT